MPRSSMASSMAMVCGRTPEAPWPRLASLSAIISRTFAVLHRLADAGGVRQHDVTLQRDQVFRADMHAREFAEAGIDAVDRRAARDDGVDRPGARFDRRERRRIEADARAVAQPRASRQALRVPASA